MFSSRFSTNPSCGPCMVGSISAFSMGLPGGWLTSSVRASFEPSMQRTTWPSDTASVQFLACLYPSYVHRVQDRLQVTDVRSPFRQGRDRIENAFFHARLVHHAAESTARVPGYRERRLRGTTSRRSVATPLQSRHVNLLHGRARVHPDDRTRCPLSRRFSRDGSRDLLSSYPAS